MELFKFQAVALLGSLLAFNASASPAVNIGMQAAFPAGPYLLELLETAATENSSSYFPLLDRIANGQFSAFSSEFELYEAFIKTIEEDGHINAPESLSTFNLALSLRTAAPRIEAHYQYYETAVATANLDTACKIWIFSRGKQYCAPTMESPAGSDLSDRLVTDIAFDRTLGTGEDAVLYADPTAPEFSEFHKALTNAASSGQLKYRLRYRRPANSSTEALPVSGYGVELALKRTDYIVIDDRDAGSNEKPRRPLGAEVFSDDEAFTDIRPLSKSELATLGIKTASFIRESENALETLVKLTQDFPRYSAPISTHNVSEEFSLAYEQASMQQVPRGVNALWINGVQLVERQIEPFSLVERLRSERKLIDAVRSLGLNARQAVSLLGHEKIVDAKSNDDETLRYDWTDRKEDGRVIIWLNDLESDSRYNEYPKTLSSLLQRSFPGQIPPIAKNIFHTIATVDFSKTDDLQFIVHMFSLIDRGVPIRFGIVPSTLSPESTANAKVAYHLTESYEPKVLRRYIESLLQDVGTTSQENIYGISIEGNESLESATALNFTTIQEHGPYEEKIKLAKRWASRLRACDNPRPIFVNGAVIPYTPNWLQAMGMKITDDLHVVQKGIFHGIIDEETWVPGIFLESGLDRRNLYVAVDEDHPLKVFDVHKLHRDHASLFETIPVIEAGSNTTQDTWAVATVIADMTSQHGQELLLSALKFRRDCRGIRLELVHNPINSSEASKVNQSLKDHEESLLDASDMDELEKMITKDEKYLVKSDSYGAGLARLRQDCKIQPGMQMILLNGRVIGPLATDDTFDADDFHLLLRVEQTNRILPVYAALEQLKLSHLVSDPKSAAKFTSITALSSMSDLPDGIFESASSVRSTLYDTWNFTETAIEVGDPETASVHLVALLNPLSEQGQRWVPILKVLSEVNGVYLKLLLNPKEKMEGLPVKRFFRYVVEAKPTFDDFGNVHRLKANFIGLPSEALLTVAVDVPPAWLVASKESVHDLDNVKLASLDADVDAMYELEHILIQGHSREGRRSSPPRGAQLVLGTEKDPHLTDTIVMANLGFFQFKSNPGFYNIHLKEGRTAEIYNIESVGAQGWTSAPGDEGTSLALMDFQGTTLYPRLQRKPGQEKADVLEDVVESDNFVSKGFKLAESILGGAFGQKSGSAQEHADINIFSVASGHLYERMLNIMMVSVMRHTKNTVKFWFIEQFLSPSFKKFIPHMAQEYGFKYEMVTYKWPHWLRQQKEKQREIWGYKILFLDVLFPLSLDKVIFVDADQIVRTDMMDLVNHDLEGAPYGFTPMCDSRTEMEGFRFWKQGYWANYLRGLPYHIPALYVVDLGRFREIAAGDRLRQQYHTLSADPNSLSNLDQDLPNHMQFQIPIHSLPQEWLWCETWCSDESQAKARTIDLCNNPQTKEPKLDRARRQVPEWTLYDDEIAALAQKVSTLESSGKSQGVTDTTSRADNSHKNPKSRNLQESGRTRDEL